MAYERIPGGSTFGLCRKMLREMLTELYDYWDDPVSVTNMDISNDLDVGNDVEITGDLAVIGDNISMGNLPTSDPANAGQLWSDSGVVTVSAG